MIKDIHETLTGLKRYRKEKHDIIRKYSGNRKSSSLITTTNENRINFSNFMIDVAKFNAYIMTILGTSNISEPFNQIFSNYENLPDGIGFLGKANNFFQPALYDNVSVMSTAFTLGVVVSSVYLLHSFTQSNKEFLKLDISQRNIYLEKFLGDIEIKDTQNRILTSPNDYDLMYLRLMNKLVIKENQENSQGIKGIDKLMNIKLFFDGLGNFKETLKIKLFSKIIDFKIIEKIMNANNYLAMEGFVNAERDKFKNINNRTITTLASILKIPSESMRDQISSKIYIYDKNNANNDTKIMDELYEYNENSLTYAYNRNLEQRMVLKFSKILSESCANSINPEKQLINFEKIIKAKTSKLRSKEIISSVNMNILNKIQTFRNDPQKFMNNTNNHSIKNIIKDIDPSMLKNGKIVFQHFQDVFNTVRNNLAYGNAYDKKISNLIANKLSEEPITVSIIEKNIEKSLKSVKDLDIQKDKMDKRKNKFGF